MTNIYMRCISLIVLKDTRVSIPNRMWTSAKRSFRKRYGYFIHFLACVLTPLSAFHILHRAPPLERHRRVSFGLGVFGQTPSSSFGFLLGLHFFTWEQSTPFYSFPEFSSMYRIFSHTNANYPAGDLISYRLAALPPHLGEICYDQSV